MGQVGIEFGQMCCWCGIYIRQMVIMHSVVTCSTHVNR